MKLSRIQFYFFGLLILIAPYTIYKIIWISQSEITVGVVKNIYSTRRSSITYPRIAFSTGSQLHTFSGYSNSDYEPGDSVSIRYIPYFPTSHSINTFWNLWAMVFIINGIIILFWTFLFVRQVITGKSFIITKKGIRVPIQPNMFRIMFIVPKEENGEGAARIGGITYSKKDNSLYYNGKVFYPLKDPEADANYFDITTGKHYLILSCKKDGNDRTHGYNSAIHIDENVRVRYWMEIRKKPGLVETRVIKFKNSSSS
jgi:hypothetical protein